jgi:hypothetical protein
MQEPLDLNRNLYTHFTRGLVFLPREAQALLVLLKLIFEDFLLWCTRPVEVFFRYKFGTRGHSLFQTVQMSLAALLLSLSISYDPLLATFAILSAGLAIYHLVEALRWEKYGSPPRFSWSHGEPLPGWRYVGRALKALGVNLKRAPLEGFICRFGEPLLCLLLALAFYPFSKALGGYLGCCTVALFLKGQIVRQRIVNLQRDQMDAIVLSQFLIGVQRDAAGQDDQRGYVVRLPDPVLRQSGDSAKPPPLPAPEQEPPAASTKDEEYIHLQCGKCRRQFQVHPKFRGRQGKCKKCRQPLSVV